MVETKAARRRGHGEDRATAHQRRLAIAADADLRRRHPDQVLKRLRSAEPVTDAQSSELNLVPSEQAGDLSQWFRDLAAQHQAFADQLAQRQSLTLPAEDPDYADLGPALPAWTPVSRDAILQPPRPQILPSARVFQRTRERRADREAVN